MFSGVMIRGDLVVVYSALYELSDWLYLLMKQDWKLSVSSRSQMLQDYYRTLKRLSKLSEYYGLHKNRKTK